MKKVFIVTQGTYSDYHICAVFDSQELAETFIASFAPSIYGPMEVEEWGLNLMKLQLKKGYRPYFVRMDKNGNSFETNIEESCRRFTSSITDRYGFDIKGNLYNHCFAKNDNHAIKITNELRVRLMAGGMWKACEEKVERDKKE